MTEWLSSIGPAVGNHLWQSTAFAAVVWLATLLLRRNQARVRYGLWLAASVKFLIPFSLLVGLGRLLPKPQHVVVAMPVSYAMDTVAQPFTETPMDFAPVEVQVSPMQRFEHMIPLALGIIWLCGVMVVLAIWGVRWRRVAKTLRQAVRVEDRREWEILRRLHTAMGAGRHIPLLMSQKLMEPGMFGIFRPVLIWPERLSERLDDEHIEAILAHELGHAQRRDNLTAVLHMVVEAAFWFYPLVWWMERRMVEERERACDEAVVEMGSRPGIYAESLLKACRFCVESPLVCVSGITGADLSKRVLSIMTLHLERLSLSKKVALALFGFIVIATPILLGQSEAAQRVMAVALQSAPAPVRAVARAMIAEEQTPSTALIAEVQAPAGAPVGGATVIQSDAKPFALDVASIRPAEPEPSNRPRRIGFQFTDDGLVATSLSLERMLMVQYRSELPADSNSIVGGPDWVRTIQWDIRGKVADSDIAEWSKLSHDSSEQAKERQSATIQAMLADRFKLKMHFETKEGTVYALVVAKGGPKLKPSPSDMPPRMVIRFGQGHISSEWMTIAGVARYLTLELGHPVIDKTGITGQYDLTLDWAPTQGATGAPGVDAGQASTPNDESKPSVFTAVQEQLGLKLEAQKGPIETLVIDQAEKPSVDGAELSALQAAPSPSQAAPTAAPVAMAVPGKLPEFDVASIKPTGPNINEINGAYTYPGGRVECVGCTLQYLVMLAFDVQYWQVSGGPSWIEISRGTRYDIEAKPPELSQAIKLNNPVKKTPPSAEQRQMLQSLLMDRFQLKFHREQKEGDVYILSRGDKPLKLQPPKDPDEFHWAGSISGGAVVDGSGVAGHNISMPELSARLSDWLGRPVQDHTGLAGTYDFEYQTGNDDPDSDKTVGIIKSMQEIGLKLVQGKGPVETIVIDHAERPSAN